ncbi:MULTISPECIES: hypothetical protein [unclassified Bradyrhizobium]|uniref:hypothetical protein n=1 Tax=unclassified Bradyrhizobium TaxID=2631580 RepID=UPI0028E6B5D9|nr:MULTISPECIES: hypothetical protein [unclassified Bradyrhizobium]
MEWGVIVIVAAGAYFLGRSSRSQKVPGIAPSRSGIAAATDREVMLSTFRREIANYLVRLDPDRYLRLYRKARSTETAIEKADKEEREAQLLLLTKRYPQYEDFDLVNTRAHVLYADGLDMHSLEEIEEHFLNLVKFQALQRTFDEDWKFRGPATSDRDLEHLQDYVKKIKDTRFLQRLKNAVQEFYVHRRDSQELGPGEPDFETNTLAVFRRPHYAEIRYGFHFKDTDEYGLYGAFFADDRDRPYESYYRSDRMFEAETGLDHLRLNEPI